MPLAAVALPEVLPERIREARARIEFNTDDACKAEEEQVDGTTRGTGIVSGEKAPDRYKEFQRMANMGRTPSRAVMGDHIGRGGEDYRPEAEGPHPVERFRQGDEVQH